MTLAKLSIHRQPKLSNRRCEITYWHNAPVRPRRAWISTAHVRERIPREARYAHDNRHRKLSSWLYGAGTGLAAGAFLAIVLMVIERGSLVIDQLTIRNIMTFAALFGMIGYLVGNNLVYPFLRVKPMNMVRIYRRVKAATPEEAQESLQKALRWDGRPESMMRAILDDRDAWRTWLQQETVWSVEPIKLQGEQEKRDWQTYFKQLRDDLIKKLEDEGEDTKEATRKADTLIPGPMYTGTPVARFDATSMHHIEKMKDERLVAQGWNPRGNAGPIAKLAGLMFVPAAAAVVLALLLSNHGDQKAAGAVLEVMTWWT